MKIIIEMKINFVRKLIFELSEKIILFFKTTHYVMQGHKCLQ